ncbi:hypothetical protein PHLGIDRAFT_120483 [Phlebiopsis gigantea 11061_1 CR5-6]|uniref:Uncharacterized protein n=1 Tax=Phlebiopsis gigantea (strain 11061_1 CR5-6) TaxID=745531 RepID=A0A0C3NIK7_PHLG1|nr:hypothetical protein PHLGIDRAFT_120483 [Phlebiopsis gigantea 11061_1 CR5-6]
MSRASAVTPSASGMQATSAETARMAVPAGEWLRHQRAVSPIVFQQILPRAVAVGNDLPDEEGVEAEPEDGSQIVQWIGPPLRDRTRDVLGRPGAEGRAGIVFDLAVRSSSAA